MTQASLLGTSPTEPLINRSGTETIRLPTLPTFFFSTAKRLPSSPTGPEGNSVRRTICRSSWDIAGLVGAVSGVFSASVSLSTSVSASVVVSELDTLSDCEIGLFGWTPSSSTPFSLSSPGVASRMNSSAPSGSWASNQTLVLPPLFELIIDIRANFCAMLVPAVGVCSPSSDVAAKEVPAVGEWTRSRVECAGRTRMRVACCCLRLSKTSCILCTLAPDDGPASEASSWVLSRDVLGCWW